MVQRYTKKTRMTIMKNIFNFFYIFMERQQHPNVIIIHYRELTKGLTTRCCQLAYCSQVSYRYDINAVLLAESRRRVK